VIAQLVVAYYALLAAGLAACIYLFVSVKLEVGRLDRRRAQAQAETEKAAARFQSELATIQERLLEAEERAGMLVPPPATISGLNLNRRTQVLRMARRGESPGQIASALRVPQGEVDLMLKVQRLVLDLPAENAQ